MPELKLFRILRSVMKTIALISTVFALPAASLLAQSHSDIDTLRSRIDSAERKINILESEVSRLRGTTTTAQVAKTKHAAPTSGVYVVVKGDSLSRIAKRHNTTITQLKSVNGLRSDNLSLGQKLRIPGAAKSAPRSAIVKSSAATGSKHKVKSGETFYSIARAYNTTTAKLVAANPSVRPTSLRVGQTLNITSTHTKPLPNRAVAKSYTKPKATAPKPPVRAAAPKPTQGVVKNPPARTPVKKSEPAIRTITVNQQMTYGQFASKYGASTTQLNALNGLSLNKSTMLAKGSELYVPQY